MQNKQNHIAVIGSGNVADRFIEYFVSKNMKVHFVARKSENASMIEKAYGVKRSNVDSTLPTDVHLAILCISDDFIEEVSKLVHCGSENTIVVHTSGTKGTEAVSNHKRYGCLYPLQTIRQGADIDFYKLPILVTGSDRSTEDEILQFSRSFNSNTNLITNLQKTKLHLAAVMSNNFTNHLLSLTYEYCQKNDVDFTLLQPLVQETMEKYLGEHIDQTQTGPAARKDIKTIKKHRSILSDDPQLKRLYNYLTKSIIDSST